jgi:hypothetical protein
MTSEPTPQSPSSDIPRKSSVGRKLMWIVVGLVAVVVIGLAVVWMNLNGIVKRTVETQATNSLDLKTTLGSANVSIFGGSLQLEDLKIASPAGYSADQMLALSGAGVKVSLGELRSDPIHVRNVTIDQPRVVIEAKGTKLNFQAIVDQQPKSDPATSGEPLKLIIDELNVNGAQVALRHGLNVPGLQPEYSLTLPSIALKNVGSGEGAQNGAAIKEVVVQLLTVIAAKAAESDQLPKELRDLLNLNVEAVAQRVGQEVNKQIDRVKSDLTKKLPPEVGGAVDQALGGKDPGKAVEQGLRGILGGDKDKDRKPSSTRPAR